MKKFFIAICILIASSAAIAEDWPCFLGPQRDAISYEQTVDAFPESGAKILWRKDLGEGFGSAAIVGDEVFILDRVDSLRDVMRCLDIKDGSEKWSVKYEAPGKFSFNGSRSTPAVDDKCVYTVGPLGHFTAYSRKDRKILWQKNIVKEFDAKSPRWVVSQSPLIYKDMVIVAPQGQKASLAAFKRPTGELVWQAPPVEGGMNYCSPMQADLCGTEQIINICGSTLVSVDPKTGKMLWKYEGWKCNAAIPNPSVMPGDRLFITGGYGAGSQIIQISKDGDNFSVEKLQTIADAGSQIANALVLDGFVFINCNTNKSKLGLACLNETGEMMWNTGKVEPASFDRGNMIAVGDKFFILDSGGYLRMIQPDPYRYEELSCVKIFDNGKNTWAAIAVSNGKMILRNYTQMACIAISPEAYQE